MLDIKDLDLETARKYKGNPDLTEALDSVLKTCIMNGDRDRCMKFLIIIKGMYGMGAHPFSKVLVKMAERICAGLPLCQAEYMEMIQDTKDNKDFVHCVEVQLVKASDEQDVLRIKVLIDLLRSLYPNGCSINRDVVKRALKVMG